MTETVDYHEYLNEIGYPHEWWVAPRHARFRVLEPIHARRDGMADSKNRQRDPRL